MLNQIHQALPKKQAETPSGNSPEGKTLPKRDVATIGRSGVAPQSDDRMKALGKQLMSQQHGEAFACHYQAALAAAGALEGDAFLEQYRGLQRIAHERGMKESEFRGFEQCLYRRFYQAATQESLRALQAGRVPKVEAEELAYIASVAAVPERDLQRYTVALERSLFVGRIRSLQA